MKHNAFVATAVLSLSMLAIPAMHAAEPTQGKVKMTSVHMRNESGTPVTVQAGDKQIMLAPGKETTFKVADGTQLTSVNQTPHHAAGSVIGTAGTEGGSTLIID